MDKIMNSSNLEDISTRLDGCRALIDILAQTTRITVTPEAALSGVSDLLEMICRDFRADIDSAKDYIKQPPGGGGGKEAQ